MDLSLVSAIRVIHFVALAVGIGAATTKNVLLVQCRRDPTWVPVFLKVERPITRQIIGGQVLLTVSGLAYAYLLGYGLTIRLVVKVALLAALWVVGPVIDTVIAPRFRSSAPAPGRPVTPAFAHALNRYLWWDLAATGIFFAILILWIVMT